MTTPRAPLGGDWTPEFAAKLLRGWLNLAREYRTIGGITMTKPEEISRDVLMSVVILCKTVEARASGLPGAGEPTISDEDLWVDELCQQVSDQNVDQESALWLRLRTVLRACLANDRRRAALSVREERVPTFISSHCGKCGEELNDNDLCGKCRPLRHISLNAPAPTRWQDDAGVKAVRESLCEMMQFHGPLGNGRPCDCQHCSIRRAALDALCAVVASCSRGEPAHGSLIEVISKRVEGSEEYCFELLCTPEELADAILTLFAASRAPVEEGTDWRKAYLDVADAISAESKGPEDLVRQARQLRQDRDTLRVNLDASVKEHAALHVYCDDLERELTALRKAAPSTPGCRWQVDDADYNTWQTACGRTWLFPDGGPKENGVKFCVECGKSVHPAPPTQEGQ